MRKYFIRMCGAAMIGYGIGAASRHRYYICGSACRKGREVCPLPMLPKDKTERFIIDRIKNCGRQRLKQRRCYTTKHWT
ncbi:MAG TPA: hypothetical protein G4N93_02370 [Dehalococcoidia bacterium]|nr:hypothetical protein [Dehalococcoidia bacterium]